ncbi:MAG: hypothetical protein K8R21_14275, partial [Leptospira sp.]|nr:hypothetical protein [Leptospira sp.]
MERIRKLAAKLRIYFAGSRDIFLFSLSLYLTCVLFNTSFHIMGVDIASEIKSTITGEYIYLILLTSIRILLFYFIFYS